LLPPEITSEMDTYERKSLREMLGWNIPNAVIRASLRLSSREGRQEVILLAGFVRRMGSGDPRVRSVALMMSHDLAHLNILGVEPWGEHPPFFGWTGKMPKHPPRDLLNYPVLIAWLARKHGVGLQIEDTLEHGEVIERRLKVTLDGRKVEDPYNLLQALSRRLDTNLLKQLQLRKSTNKNKRDPRTLELKEAHRFSIYWGLEGLEDPHRTENLAFIRPNSSFSDTEIKVILGARLFAWPTEVAKSVRAGRSITPLSEGGTQGRCSCGEAIQTITHILNVPQNSNHSEELRSIVQSRHKGILQQVTSAIKDIEMWTKLIGPEAKTDLDTRLQEVMDAIGLARGRGILTNPPRGEADPEPDEGPNRRTQHYKPDLLLVRTDLNDRLHFIIADVTAGSDDKLIVEDEYTRYILAREKTHDKLTDHMRSNKFTDEGRITRTGLQELHQTMRPDAERVHYFKQSHYAKRYASLAGVLREAGGEGCTVETRVLAVGVCGWIPKFTRTNMKALLEVGDTDSARIRRRHKSLIRSTIIEALNHLVRAHRAWVKE
jgi:hypothetical protein